MKKVPALVALLQTIAAERCKFGAETEYERTRRHYKHRDVQGLDALRYLCGWHVLEWLYHYSRTYRVITKCVRTVMVVAAAYAIIMELLFPGWFRNLFQ